MDWDRIAEQFEQAIELGTEERTQFLSELAERDPQVAERVHRLLEHDGGDTGFLRTRGGGSLEDSLFASLVGTRIGEFELGSVVAVGGMGAVYEARQSRPDRRVALKIMRLGLSDPNARRRFRHEAEVLARLDHPGIAKVFAAGIHSDPERFDGLEIPFFAMEFVEEAKPLLEHAQDAGLDMRERVQLAVQICDAVLHGHQNGIVHRDLKSANVLVDAHGQPKVIDFGIARSRGAVPGASLLATRAGELLGTPASMSPEQLLGNPDRVDSRSDVYSLGVVFFELLAGFAPFDLENCTIGEILRIVREDAPRPLGRNVPKELAWVLGKALEKEPERRYATASELGADLRRWLASEPLEAGPPTWTYRLRKLARKHRIAVATVGIVIAAIVTGAAAATWGWLEARAANKELIVQRDAASQAEAKARAEANKAVRVSDFFAGMFRASHPTSSGRDVRVVDILDRTLERIEVEFADQPELLVAYKVAVGESYLGLGLPGEAEQPSLEAVRLSKQVFGEVALDTSRTQRQLARVHLAFGRHQEALEVLESALVGAERFGTELDRLLVRYDIAQQYLALARFEEGESLLVSVIDGMEVNPEASESLAWEARIQLGALYLDTDRPAEAAAVLERCVEWLRGGSRNPAKRLTAENNLSVAYSRLGRQDEALALIEENVALREEWLGGDHPDTIGAKHNWATDLMEVGRYDQAGEVLEQVYAARERQLGSRHQRTLTTLNQMAALEKRRGNLQGAEELMARVVAGARGVIPEANPLFGMFLASHGALLSELGRPAEATVLIGESLTALEASGPAGASTLEKVRALHGKVQQELESHSAESPKIEPDD